MLATTRLLTLSTLIAMLLGLILIDQAGAAPFRPRPYSESSRLEAKDDCRLAGGTSFETVYHYDYGGNTPTSATTTCHGGKNDGQTCQISGSSKTCTQALVSTNSPTAVSTGSVLEIFPASAPPATRGPQAVGAFQTTNLAEDDKD